MDVVTQLFTTFGVTWAKFLSQIVLFAVVYFILSKFAFGPVLKMLDERRRRIEEGQLNAEKIKKQLADAELRYQEILKKANDDAQALIDEARHSTEAQTQRHLQQAVKDAESIIQRANETIELERTKMINEVKEHMVGLVVDTTAKVAGKILTSEDQKRLSEETTKELAA